MNTSKTTFYTYIREKLKKNMKYFRELIREILNTYLCENKTKTE